MYKKLVMWSAGAGAAVVGLVASVAAHAQTFVVPTSTASSLTANIGSQFADPGTLTVVVVAAGIPLAFYVIHQLMGLLPKSRARRS